jgi:hypothetical protein
VVLLIGVAPWFLDRRCAVVRGSLIGGAPWCEVLVTAVRRWWLELLELVAELLKFIPVFLLRRRLRLWWLLSGGLHWMCEV